MQAIVLCAGMGTRLGERTKDLPKTMVELNGRPVFNYIWTSLQESPVEDIIVVGGYEFEKLSNYVNSLKGKPVRVVFNADYKLGSILTIEKALPYVREGFVVMNGDHIHPPAMMRRFLEPITDITCAVDRDRNLTDDDMKVSLTPEGRVAQMDKKLTQFDCGYIGMTQCPASHLELYKHYARITRERHGDGANVERIVHTLAGDGKSPSVRDVSGIGWVEIDNEYDLQVAHQMVKTNPHLGAL